MAPWIMRKSFVAMLFAAFASLPGLSAEDPKSPATDKKDETPAPTEKMNLGTAPIWTKYAFVSEEFGEIVRSDDSTITLRVFYLVPANQNPKQRLPRPSLHMKNGRSSGNPYRQMKPNQPTVKWDHHDYTIAYAPESLVRWQTLAPKIDEKGHHANYTAQEKEQARAPLGVPGYAASKSDLVPGTLVDLSLIRDRSITLEKMVESDLRLKYVIITGKDPNPPKDITSPAPMTPKPGKKN